MKTTPLAALHNVSKVYQLGDVPVHALDNVSLEIAEGELIVVLGPSGSGKTTTLNLLGGLDRPTEGRILVAGEEISAYDDDALTDYRRRMVGFVFQFFNLMPTLTARENVEFALELVEQDRRRIAQRAEEILAQVGLAEIADRFPYQMSGGQQQRVAVARAVAKQPRLLLCDEPTGNLDTEAGRNVLETIQSLNREYGTTVVLVTHNTAIAEMADRVIRMHDGRIAEEHRNLAPKPASAITW
ncbi:MAG: ABC transporter ATP-binding protein [Ardenticatenia bacterium]|nr:MAG: ABC transporter ATP-binding protein [Ardenticatenia bacterium]